MFLNKMESELSMRFYLHFCDKDNKKEEINISELIA